MMVNIKEYSSYVNVAFRAVFKSWKTIFSVILLFNLFILVNLVFLEYLQIGALLFSGVAEFFDAVWYAWMTMPVFSKIMLSLISLLSALLIVFTYIAFKQNQRLNGSVGSGGIILGVLAPACPSCGIGVISLLGFGSLGAFLPFGGQEIGIVAVVVLLASLLYVSRQIAAPVCKVK